MKTMSIKGLKSRIAELADALEAEWVGVRDSAVMGHGRPTNAAIRHAAEERLTDMKAELEARGGDNG